MVRLLLIVVVIALIVWMFRGSFSGGGARIAPDEAAKILGVGANAGADEIIAAHKKLIAKVHPDAGGNAELAARVNQARDVLLARISKQQG